MPEANRKTTTHRKRSKGTDVEEMAAAAAFEAMTIPSQPNGKEFMERARISYVAMCGAFKFLAMTPDQLLAFVRRMGPDGFGGVNENLDYARDWLKGGAKILNQARARLLVVAARLSLETEGGR